MCVCVCAARVQNYSTNWFHFKEAYKRFFSVLKGMKCIENIFVAFISETNDVCVPSEVSTETEERKTEKRDVNQSIVIKCRRKNS